MESSLSRTEQERRKQIEIRKQIALLRAQLTDGPPEELATPPSPKRKVPEPTTLVPATPSPKKKRKLAHDSGQPSGRPLAAPNFSGKLVTVGGPGAKTARKNMQKEFSQPAPSKFLSKLSSIKSQPADIPERQVNRTVGFGERPQVGSEHDASLGVRRDERLAIVEDFTAGPYDHKPLFDDPLFESLEPNSGIRLSKRVLPHEDLQEHLRGRFYLSPSKLYSSIKLLPDKQGYDVPVPGDWVTIAVIAERGLVKLSKAPVAVGVEENGAQGAPEKGNGTWKGKGKKPEVAPKPSGKKYVNLKLIDFGARAKGSSDTGGKAVIRGDAFLSLLLFESDSFEMVAREEGGKPEKMYKGGSKGAFEMFYRFNEGDVIALLNPKILKPYQRSTDKPHPTNNILALTPESAASIEVIGRAQDFGRCNVTKRDGKRCGSWTDKRVSEVCEWHLQNAVEHRRAGRAEFSVGTTGMSTTSAPKRKPAYDPARQWGLKPENEVGNTTYVVSGHVVGGSGADSRSLHVSENIGREGQAKAKRQLTQNADKVLKALLERDKEGMKSVVAAREAAKKFAENEDQDGSDGSDEGKGTGNAGGHKVKAMREHGKRKEAVESPNGDDESGSALPSTPATTGAKAYSAEVIKRLGFDPTLKGSQRVNNSSVQKKLETLAAVQKGRKKIALGPKPGQKVRSGVVAPLERERDQEHEGENAGEMSNVSAGDAGEQSGLVDLDSDG